MARSGRLSNAQIPLVLRYFWVYKTTANGKVLVAGIFISGGIGSASLLIPAHTLLCVLSGLAAAAVVAGFLMRPRLELRGVMPDKAVAGQPLMSLFTVRNLGRRPAYDVASGYFGLPKELAAPETGGLPQLEGESSASLTIAITPLRRGLYHLPPLRVYTTFPFNLFRTSARQPRENQRRLSGGKLLVLPDFHPLDHVDAPLGRRYQPGGIAMSSNVGESPEYIGNREYRAGDSARHIDFRAWARLAKPVVREFQEEYYCRVALVLDTYVPGRKPAPPEGFAHLEAAVSLAAAVADALSRGDYIIDIFAAGPELYVFRAGRHTAHLENILEILSCVDPCRHNPFDIVTPAIVDEMGSISSLICVFLDWDESRRGLARTALENGAAVKVLIVREGATSLPIAGTDEFDEIQQLTPAEIRSGGVEAV